MNDPYSEQPEPNQEWNTILENIVNQTSQPALSLTTELNQNPSLVFEEEGNNVSIWTDEKDKDQNRPARFIATVDTNGRMIQRIDTTFNKMESWAYDDDGYIAQHAIQFIKNQPSGWMRTYTYTSAPDGKKQLSEIRYQTFETPSDEAGHTSTATQNNPSSMIKEVERGEKAQKQSLNLASAVADLIQTGNDTVVTFINGKPNTVVFVGRTSL